MLAEACRRGVAAAVIFYCGACGTAPALSAEVAKTTLGRSVFAVLDDDNPLIRAYGWRALGWLGGAPSTAE